MNNGDTSFGVKYSMYIRQPIKCQSIIVAIKLCTYVTSKVQHKHIQKKKKLTNTIRYLSIPLSYSIIIRIFTFYNTGFYI